MDSPALASPRTVDHRQFWEDVDDIDDDSFLLLFQRANSIKPLYRTLAVVILSVVFGVVVSTSFPLWRPVGVLMLHKLWDILRFLVITTSIGLGIMNSRFGRSNHTDRDVGIAAAGRSKEDSGSSKVPFVGLFYGELQPSSYSFDDKEMEAGDVHGNIEMEAGADDGIVSRSSESGIAANTTTSSAMARADDDDDDKFQVSGKLVNDDIPSNKAAAKTNEHNAKLDEDRPGSGGEEPAIISLPSVKNTMKVAPKLTVLKASDDMCLPTVVENEGPKHRSKISHRRGSSVEFPIKQAAGSAGKHGDVVHSAAPPDYRRRDADAASSSRKAGPLSASKMTDDLKSKSDESLSCKTDINASSASTTTTSKHSRSRSAYDLNELLVYERRPTKTKPGTSTSQLARRRKVSLSCDLDRDFSAGGMPPAWLAALPSPPEPPLMPGEGDIQESSLRKAYSESLAPWRAATIAIQTNIPQKEATDQNKKRHPTRKEKKGSLMKETTGGLPTPPSSPSTPNSFKGSPSPGELNKKVDAFIARFHERMRLQRLESFERSRQRAL